MRKTSTLRRKRRWFLPGRLSARYFFRVESKLPEKNIHFDGVGLLRCNLLVDDIVGQAQADGCSARPAIASADAANPR